MTSDFPEIPVMEPASRTYFRKMDFLADREGEISLKKRLAVRDFNADNPPLMLSVDSQLPLIIDYSPLLNDVLDRLSMNSDFKKILFTMKSSKE